MTGTTMVFIWLAIAVVLGIIEAATVALVSIWFAIGAVAAMVPAYLNAPFWAQILVFVLVSALCFAFTRPFFQKVIKVKSSPPMRTALLGRRVLQRRLLKISSAAEGCLFQAFPGAPAPKTAS